MLYTKHGRLGYSIILRHVSTAEVLRRRVEYGRMILNDEVGRC